MATKKVTHTIISKAKRVIREADVVIITAGAGMGVDSGLKDFRGNDGFWEAYPALGNKKMSFASVATQQVLNENPHLAWALYGHMFDIFHDVVPHTGFQSLLELALQKEDYFVVTSNIDGHFQKAEFEEDKIYEIHGRMNKFQCTQCGELWDVPDDTRFNVDSDLFELQDPPTCKDCGGIARPNIMMFFDYGFDNEETEDQAKRFNKFMNKYDKGDHKIAIIEFGAGEGVPTIRMMGEYIQKNVEGATLIRVNPLDYEGPEGTISVKVGALDAINILI